MGIVKSCCSPGFFSFCIHIIIFLKSCHIACHIAFKITIYYLTWKSILDTDLKILLVENRDVTQWWSPCLACERSWVQFSALPKKQLNSIILQTYTCFINSVFLFVVEPFRGSVSFIKFQTVLKLNLYLRFRIKLW